MKKLACIAITSLLSLSLFSSCAFQSSSSASSANPSSAAQQQTEEPVTIVFYQNSGAGSGAGSEAGSNPDDLKLVQDYILEKTGVWLDARLAPKEGAAEKLSMMLAGGDQLDLWYGNWQEYKNSGIIQSLNDLLKNAQAVVDAWEPWDSWPSMTDNEGNIWGVPRMTPTTPYPVFVRQDWLEKLNMKQPATMEELEAYLYAVKDADFFGNGQTIPLITRGSNLNALEKAFIAGYVQTGSGNFLDSDGKVKPIMLADGYKEFLEKMHQWYADGILHKENIGWDTNTVRDQIAKGAVGATATWYSDITLRAEVLRQNNPDAVYDIYEPGLTGSNGQKVQTISKGSTNGLLLSSKCKNPEAAMKVVNWMYEDWYNYQIGQAGVENIHWKYADDPDAAKNNITVTIPKTEGGNSGYFSDCALSMGLPMETKVITYDADGIMNMHSMWLREHLDDFDSCMENFEQNIFYNTVELQENVPTLSDINRIRDEELSKFLTGQRSLDEYDQFIDELYAAGLETYIEEYTRQYNLLK